MKKYFIKFSFIFLFLYLNLFLNFQAKASEDYFPSCHFFDKCCYYFEKLREITLLQDKNNRDMIYYGVQAANQRNIQGYHYVPLSKILFYHPIESGPAQAKTLKRRDEILLHANEIVDQKVSREFHEKFLSSIDPIMVIDLGASTNRPFFQGYYLVIQGQGRMQALKMAFPLKENNKEVEPQVEVEVSTLPPVLLQKLLGIRNIYIQSHQMPGPILKNLSYHEE